MRRNSKDKITRAALDVFVLRGYDAATTREIAALSEVSEGAIYRHYRSKDEIARALFLSIHRSVTDLITAAAARLDELGFEGTVGQLVQDYCALADADWTLFAFHLLQLHRFLHLWDDADGDPVTAVRELIGRAAARGDIPSGNEELRAGMVLGVLSQVAQNKAYGRLPQPLSDHAPAFTAAVLAVLRAT
jgi:AcrR family transcriptional regulator